MKKFIIKNWKWVLLLIVVGIIGLRAYQRFGVEKPLISQEKIVAVETYPLFSKNLEPLNLNCIAEPRVSLTLTPQSSGTVKGIYVEDGNFVEEGQILFELDNIQQRVALQDAKVALDSAKLALQDLRQENNTSDSGSLLSQRKRQQDALVEQARNNLFNIDLRAYPKDDPQDTTRPAPEVLGNYTCAQEGQYNIEVYSSASNSGASYRYSGLESGTSSVSLTSFGTDLGNCGLELIFPENFSKNEEWVIPVPNTQSSQYFSALKAYEQAIENREIALNTTETSPELIAQQEGRVTQAGLRYQLAFDNYEKTRIKAETSGVLNNFSLEIGSFVNAFSEVGSIKTVDQLELVAFVGQSDRGYIRSGLPVRVNDTLLSVGNVNLASDTVTRRSKVTIPVTDSASFQEGEQYICEIDRAGGSELRSDGGIVVPLSALSVIGTDTFVFVVNEESITQAVSVSTGALLGNEIVIYADIEGSIVKDARGIRNNQKVTLNLQN